MTVAVDFGRKATKQTNKIFYAKFGDVLSMYEATDPLAMSCMF